MPFVGPTPTRYKNFEKAVRQKKSKAGGAFEKPKNAHVTYDLFPSLTFREIMTRVATCGRVADTRFRRKKKKKKKQSTEIRGVRRWVFDCRVREHKHWEL